MILILVNSADPECVGRARDSARKGPMRTRSEGVDEEKGESCGFVVK